MGLRLNWAVVICLVSSITCDVARGVDSEIKFKKAKLELRYKKNIKIINVELAETEEQHARGLMFRKKLNKDEGMLFKFTDEQIRNFWMKNTLIDLDIGYFDKNKNLIDIKTMSAQAAVMQTNFPSYPSKLPAMFALEMVKGWFKKNKFPEGTTFVIIAGPKS